MPGDFGSLTLLAGLGPSPAVNVHFGPDVAVGDEFLCCSGAGVAQVVKLFEDPLSEWEWDVGSLLRCRVAVDFDVSSWDGNEREFDGKFVVLQEFS